SEQFMFAWSPPGSGINRFPNADRYTIDVENSPADFNVPGRATSKLFTADYLGPVSRDWGDMIFERADAPIQWDNTRGASSLMGQIEHGLPGPLENVTVFLITSNYTGDRAYAFSSASQQEEPWVVPGASHSLPNFGYMASGSTSGPWNPGEPLALDTVINFGQTGTFELSRNLKDLVRGYGGTSTITAGAVSQSTARDYFEMLGLYHLLDPPVYLRGQGDGGARFRRSMAREADLSAFFNRPCIIVTGFLEDVPSPVPLAIDGAPAEVSDGLTFLRWIYPLPLDEERAFDLERDDADASDRP
ncbi:MAG: hypothetical protein F6K11_32185, partial [Leptolyngbya sp. SIO3F4]|nr:hypothetical protein [Leptolyngbya sp. SIO3F4]